MPVALSLHFDRATADAVRAVWDALAKAGASRDMVDFGYPPHLTLIVVDDESFAAALVAALLSLGKLASQSMRLGDVRQFEGTSVTWISLAGDRARLDALHRAAVTSVPTDAVHPHYRPVMWTPHVTLALNGVVPKLLDTAREAWVPREGRTSRLEVARFPPARPIAGIDLPV